MTHPASSQPHDADWYEIRVQGRLDPRWSAYLDGAQLAPGSGGTTTVLTGRVVDQAALHGLLAGLRDLGLPLISVARVDHEPDHPHQEPTGEPT